MYYNVYLGNFSPPPLIAYNLTYNNTYVGQYPWDVNGLQPNMHYYWKITSRDVHGVVTEGPLWQFDTMISYPPGVPYNPNPPNESGDVSIEICLSWSCEDPDIGDTITYDVFFGTSSSGFLKVASNQTISTYHPENILEYSTTYYWQIVARDNHNVTTVGDIWQFTTEEEIKLPTPIVNITSIKGGHVLEITVANTGNGEAQPVNVTASFRRGFILPGKTLLGTIDKISSGNSATVHFPVFGIALRTELTVKVDCPGSTDTTIVTAHVIGPFVIIRL